VRSFEVGDFAFKDVYAKFEKVTFCPEGAASYLLWSCL